MIYANSIAGAVAVLLMSLVARGFAPHIRVGAHDAPALMRLSVVIVSAMTLLRMAWWDGLRPILGYLGHMPPVVWTTPGIVANTLFNLLAAAAALAALGALHRSLPDEDRAGYTWLTAPFYPRKWQIFRKDGR